MAFPLALLSLVPSVIDLFNRGGNTAEKVVNLATATAQVLTGKDDEPEMVAALKADPAKFIEFQNAMNAQAITLYQEETKRLEAVNETVRAEAASADPYVRRMRPTFGYVMAASVIGMMGIIGYTVIVQPAEAGNVVRALGEATDTLFMVGLSVLGVYVYKRSGEKTGASGPGFNALSGMFRR